MKKIIFNAGLYLVRIGINFLYFFIKIFPTKKNKITMLSRQSNEVNIDFKLLIDEINKKEPNMQIELLTKMIPTGIMAKIGYCFYMIKCMYHIATSKLCVTDGYSIPISALNHKKSLIIIQIWHAMGAIKKFGLQVLDKKEGSNEKIAKIMKMHRNYTNIICTSESTKEFYAEAFNTDINKILALGMPRIDYLLGKEGKIDEKVDELIKLYPKLEKKKNILYVPTFRKGRTIDIKNIVNNINKEKYNLIIKLHPLDKTNIDEQFKINNKFKTFEILKVADYVITDYSAVAFEAATLDKQLFFYLYDINEYEENRGLNINLKEEMKDSTFSDIIPIIDIIETGKYNFSELERFKNKYVQTVDTKNSKRIAEYMLEKMKM